MFFAGEILYLIFTPMASGVTVSLWIICGITPRLRTSHMTLGSIPAFSTSLTLQKAYISGNKGPLHLFTQAATTTEILI